MVMKWLTRGVARTGAGTGTGGTPSVVWVALSEYKILEYNCTSGKATAELRPATSQSPPSIASSLRLTPPRMPSFALPSGSTIFHPNVIIERKHMYKVNE